MPRLAVFDGGAEFALISQQLYHQLSPKSELRPTTESKAFTDPNVVLCARRVEIPELSVVVNYHFIVDNIEEDILTDASMLHYAQIQLRYDT